MIIAKLMVQNLQKIGEKRQFVACFFKFISETDSSIFNLFSLLQPYKMYITEWLTFQNTHWLGIAVFDKKLVWFWKKNWHDFKIGGRKSIFLKIDF